MFEVFITEIAHNIKHASMITGFVFLMMMAIEYINVQSKGKWQKVLQGSAWKQLFFSAFLGAIPGCLGAFTVVSFFSHRMVSLGSVVAAMIATSGDEAFVMLSLFPKETLWLSMLLLIIGIVAGFLTDKFYKSNKILINLAENKFPLHEDDDCHCFQKKEIVHQLLHPTVYRVLLFVIVILLLITISTGFLAGKAQPWIRVTLLIAILFSLFVTLTVPNHFLKQHLWNHVVMVHIPRIFLWTFGTLFVFGMLMHYFHLGDWLSQNMIWVLVVAVLVGIIPESGPHLIFVTLFFEGSIPFSILFASSISQDGHGMLPMLAESKRGFIVVKLINMTVAMGVGLVFYYFGF